jgi:hypothetical protein
MLGDVQTQTQAQPQATGLHAHHVTLPTHISKSTTRRVGHVAAAVVLVTAGALLAVYLSPEVGAALIASGVHQLVSSFTTDDEVPPCSTPAPKSLSRPLRPRLVHEVHERALA